MKTSFLKTNRFRAIRILLLFVFPAALFMFFSVHSSEAVQLLAPLGGTGSVEGPRNIGQYIANLYYIGVGLAGVLAVLMIIIGGVEYIAGAANPSARTDANKRIWAAIGGLLIALLSWIILNTINPNLVNFDLSLDSLSSGTPRPNLEVSTGAGSNCRDCTAVSGIPIKSSGLGACAGGIQNCQLNKDLLSKLRKFNDNMSSENLSWNLTEGYPPTVKHSNPCHSSGTCADVGFINKKEQTPKNIIKAIDAAKSAGLSPQWEVKTSNEYRSLIDAGVPAENVAVVSRITAPHFSIYDGSIQLSPPANF